MCRYSSSYRPFHIWSPAFTNSIPLQTLTGRKKRWGTRNGKRWYNMIRGEGKANKTRGERRCGVGGSFEGLKGRVERMAKGNCFLDTRKEMLCRREFAWCLMLAVRYFWQGQDGQGVKIMYIFLKKYRNFTPTCWLKCHFYVTNRNFHLFSTATFCIALWRCAKKLSWDLIVNS